MTRHFFSLAFLGILSCVSVIRGDNSKQCQRWSHAAGNSTINEPGLQQHCQKNTTCTGITCSGIYHYSIARYARRNVDYCFGFHLNPCIQPVTVDVYLTVPEKNVNYVGRFHNSNNIQVPGLTYNIAGRFVTADVFLEVKMGTVINHSVLFGVDLTVRADFSLGQSWPEGLKRSLVPQRNLFVRSCNSTLDNAPDLIPGHCTPMTSSTPAPPATTKAPKPPKPGQSTSAPGPTTATKAPPATTSATGTGKKCDDKMLNACGANKYCDNGVCMCYDENLDGKGGCTEYSTKAPLPTPKAVPSVDGKGDSKSNTTVIVSSVIGGVVVILLIVVVVLLIVRWRRSRDRYSNHELLLNNDDDNMVM